MVFSELIYLQNQYNPNSYLQVFHEVLKELASLKFVIEFNFSIYRYVVSKYFLKITLPVASSYAITPTA